MKRQLTISIFWMLGSLSLMLTVLASTPRDSESFHVVAGMVIALLLGQGGLILLIAAVGEPLRELRSTPEYSGKVVVAGTVVPKEYNGALPESARLGQGLFVETIRNSAGYDIVRVVLFPGGDSAYLAGYTSSTVAHDQWNEELSGFVEAQYKRD